MADTPRDIQGMEPSLRTATVMQMAATLAAAWLSQRDQTTTETSAQLAMEYYQHLRANGF